MVPCEPSVELFLQTVGRADLLLTAGTPRHQTDQIDLPRQVLLGQTQ